MSYGPVKKMYFVYNKKRKLKYVTFENIYRLSIESNRTIVAHCC